MLKAIETSYKGYRFRSRLEARWAVFFDALGVSWEYEFEGFHTEIGGYLPDFYMPDGNYYIEIKPHKNLSEREIVKAMYVAIERPITVLCGTPDIPIVRNEKLVSGPVGIAFNTVEGSGRDVIKKISGERIRIVSYNDDQWAIAEIVKLGFLDQIGVHINSDRATAIDGRPWLWHERNDGSFLLWPHPAVELTREDTGIAFFGPQGDTGLSLVPMLTTKKIDTPRLREAVKFARSARFEHGERP